MPVERWLETLVRAAGELAAYLKDPIQRDVQLALVAGWKSEVKQLIEAWDDPSSGHGRQRRH